MHSLLVAAAGSVAAAASAAVTDPPFWKRTPALRSIYIPHVGPASVVLLLEMSRAVLDSCSHKDAGLLAHQYVGHSTP